jgi:hypothetical protein
LIRSQDEREQANDTIHHGYVIELHRCATLPVEADLDRRPLRQLAEIGLQRIELACPLHRQTAGGRNLGRHAGNVFAEIRNCGADGLVDVPLQLNGFGRGRDLQHEAGRKLDVELIEAGHQHGQDAVPLGVAIPLDGQSLAQLISIERQRV